MKETYLDDEYLRRHEHEEFARRVDQENKRQNRRLDIIDSTLSQLNELTIQWSPGCIAINAVVKPSIHPAEL